MTPLPRTAADWCANAWAEHRQGRRESAMAAFQRAMSIDPSSFPARFGLASLLLERGDAAEADTVAAQVTAAEAGRPDILWLQARIAQARGDAPKVRDMVTRLLGDTRLGEVQRAEALLMLGLALGDLGQSADAFAAASRGKQIQRALHAVEANAREGEVTKLRRLGAWISSEPTDWKPLLMPDIPAAAATHVFLLGFPRSGTTLLEQVLAAHANVLTLEEEATLATPYQAFLSDAEACAALTCLEADEAEAWASHYWSGIHDRGLDVSGKLFVDKQPAGTLNLPVIARLFPRAKILFAIRDPRDVVLSCFRQAFQMNAMTYTFTDLVETAACYDACMALAEAARPRLPLAWMHVRHEALVEDFDGEIARILDFLGLAPDNAMRDFASIAATRTIRTPSATQVRAGLNRRGLGRWEQYRGELAPVLPALAPWVERLCYRPQKPT